MRCQACGTENEEGRKFCGECGAPLTVRCGGVRDRERARREVLRRVRRGAAAPSPRRSPAACRAGRRAAAGLDPLRRPGRVHHAVGGPRRRGRARAPVALLRHLPDADRPLRRHRREVHRRRGDGGVGRAGGDGGRRRAGGARGARPGRRGRGARRGGRLARAARPRRRAHRRGGGHDRRRRPRGWWPATWSTPPRGIQSVAEPGTVLVGESTKRATEAAVVYEDAGAHELKGKAEPVRLWRAVRVVAGVGGAQPRRPASRRRSSAATASCALIKELFHASADEAGPARLGRSGSPGSASRGSPGSSSSTSTAWPRTCCWHRGRCLPYGEGVAFWALAEMVRARARIAEGEDAESQRAKLHAAVEELDPRRGRAALRRAAAGAPARPRGRAPRRAREPVRAWRLFFERLADDEADGARLRGHAVGRRGAARLHRVPAGLVARPSALRDHARPARADRAASDLGRRQAQLTSLYLEPLATRRDGRRCSPDSSPGCPTSCAAASCERAEGMPLYAVETVRMLLDRGLLVQRGARYRPAGDDRDARGARDAACAGRGAPGRPRAGDERRLLQDAAVLGKTFTVEGARDAERAAAAEVEPVLAGARAQGGAVAPGRPALAGAGPVRVPAGPGAAGGVRDAVEARPARQAPGRRGGARGGRGRAGRGRRRPLPGGLPGRSGRRRRGRDRTARGRGIAPGRPARGVARRRPRGTALLRAGGGVRRWIRSSRQTCSSMPG